MGNRSSLAAWMDEFAGDAMSDGHEMDTTTTDFAHAACNAIAENLHTILGDQFKEMAKPLGPLAKVTLVFDGLALVPTYGVALVIVPDTTKSRPHTVFGPDFLAAIAKAEEWIADYVKTHRVMTAEDLGL